MKTKITGLLTFLIGTFFFYSCDTDVEALEIQKARKHMTSSILRICVPSRKAIMR